VRPRPGALVWRLLLWDLERGSLAYDVLCVLILAFILLVPGGWLSDPMAVRR
jgi:hypothetical protein